MAQHRDKINGKKLELFLEKLDMPEKYNLSLEQYPTDSRTASIILLNAFLDGNIYGKKVIDLGTGNGILALGSKFLGAEDVTAVDIDENMISLAGKNADKTGMKINLVRTGIENVTGEYDTVVMNPPFGSIIKHDDIIFMDRALDIGTDIYSIHNIKSYDFIIDYYKSRAEIIRLNRIFIDVPNIYKHHSREHYDIEALFIYAHKI